MRVKRILIAVIAMVFALSSAAMAYADTGESMENTASELCEQTGSIPGSEDVDETEVLPPCDEEYVIDSYVGPILEPGEGIAPRKILVQSVSFKKISSTKARMVASITGNTETTKLIAKAELYKKQGDTYKSTGKSDTISQAGVLLNGYITFAVAANAKYKVKVTVTEYKGSSKSVKTPAFYVLNSNGY